MKNLLILITTLILIKNLSYSQTNINQDSMISVISNYLKTIEPTIQYADHSNLSTSFLDLILTCQDDKILEIIHTPGFNNFDKIVYLNHYPIHSTLIISDSIILNELNEIRQVFPKDISTQLTSITSEEIANDLLTRVTWNFAGTDQLKYKVIIYFTNNQITTIGYNTFK